MKGKWAFEFTFRYLPRSFEGRPFFHANSVRFNGGCGYFGWLWFIFNWSLYRERVIVLKPDGTTEYK